MKTIIALSGWRGSGKDTFGGFLVKDHGYQRLAFADALKDHVSMVYSFPRDWCDGNAKDQSIGDLPVNPQDPFAEMVTKFLDKEFVQGHGFKKFWSPRALCILEGSVKRTVNPHVWVRKVWSKIAAHEDPDACFVITDMRYQSELKYLAEQAERNTGIRFLPVRIERYSSHTSTDPSERDLDQHSFPVKIDNTECTLEQLQVEAARMASKLKWEGRT